MQITYRGTRITYTKGSKLCRFCADFTQNPTKDGVNFMGIIKERIKDIPFINELEETALTNILKIVRLSQYKNHGQIFSLGDPLNQIYFILKGKVKVFKKDSSGKELIVWIMQEGDIFPLTGFFNEVTFPANAEAIEDTIIVSIGTSEFESIILGNPEVLIKLLRVMGDRIVDLQTRLEEQIFLEKYMQIVKLLMRLCEQHGKVHQNGQCQFKTQFSNTDLAKMVGTTRWCISRAYSQLKKERLLYKNDNGDVIIEFEKLREKFG
jgi:CRP/FNR family transcriptional regulator